MRDTSLFPCYLICYKRCRYEKEKKLLELLWMKKYRRLVETWIRMLNIYTLMYTSQVGFGTEILISASQIQTLEYILESKDQKMSEIAKRLGITRSTFSKNVKKLVEKGLLQKYSKPINKKEIYLEATPKGIAVYSDYSKYIYQIWFKEMFEIADEIPNEYILKFEQIIEGFTESFVKTGSINTKQNL